MKKYLAPSILSADFTKLGEQLNVIEHAGAEYLHLDVMDGIFVPSISFGMPVIQSIRNHTKMLFDVHMMVVDPERYIGDIRRAGADIISVHIEACHSPKNVLMQIGELGAKPALAISPETSISELEEYLPYLEQVIVKVDMLLIMTVNPGFGGQKILPESFDRVRELADMRAAKGLDFAIEVDGGANADNIAHIFECGADIVVAGSAVFKGDIKSNVDRLLSIVEQI